MHSFTNLRQYLALLHSEGELVEIHTPVDPTLELPEIHRRVAAAGGPALLFRNVKGSAFPVVTNQFGSTKRVNLAFHRQPERLVKDLVELATKQFPPTPKVLWKNKHLLKSMLRLGMKKRRSAPVTECSQTSVNLNALPFTKSWPEDGGHFLTLPLVYTEPPDGNSPPNLGMYRIQRHSENTTGLHWQIGKGGGFHHHLAEQNNQNLPVSIFLGGPPALILSAIAPLPENVPELILCSLLQEKKIDYTQTKDSPHRLLSECEFALVGHAPPQVRKMEGPFGDHYGYYSLEHEFPVFNCTKVFHRKDAIFPATVVGKPIQEDFYIGDYLQELLSPLFPVVMPGVKDLWSYGETGFHSLGAAVVKERYFRECMSSAFRILGEGQLSLTKFLLLTDQPAPLRNFKKTLEIILERFQPETDLYIFSNLSLDTLDYTGPKLNQGSRGVLVGTGDPIRTLPEEFQGSLPQPLSKVQAYCKGCLVIESPPYEQFQDWQTILTHPDFQKWPLIVAVDSIEKALKNNSSFLWTTFTRFEPAADIHTKPPAVIRHHLSYTGPILIDARMKPSYPKEVLCDDETGQLVDQRWSEYFPQKVEMGDSLAAHVC